ncbi:ABC transporter E family member 2-like protein [Tanacetum coccineum]|uniref:ABC transporter E family member 2-like protein n=1 Tax=Tanacetum coccineum TaxID=301880 RepID=A0ABQ4WQZ2_9ASTR
MLRVLNGDDMYSTMTIAAQDGLKLKVVEAKFADSEIIVLLRELGTGKTTFIHLLSQQRYVASRIVRRFVTLFNKTAFVVEHDFTMARHLAYKVIVFEGTPSIDCVAKASQLWNHFSGLDMGPRRSNHAEDKRTRRVHVAYDKLPKRYKGRGVRQE